MRTRSSRACWPGAAPEDIVEFMSVAGLPARAVRTPWLRPLPRAPAELGRSCAPASARCTMAFDCLIQCGLRDGIAKVGQFCIDTQLAAALRGDVEGAVLPRRRRGCPSAARSARCAS